jgi:hypothetical protein
MGVEVLGEFMKVVVVLVGGVAVLVVEGGGEGIVSVHIGSFHGEGFILWA